MSDLIEADSSKSKPNPLFWIALVVIGLIAYIFIGTERGSLVASKSTDSNDEKSVKISGDIERNLLVPPGMRARQFVEQLRIKGQPYPLEDAFQKAKDYQQEGSLADAHLMYFFAAREGHTEAMMKMAEMSDPTLFRAEDSLLDHADALQSYKWYQKVAEQGRSEANARIQGLQQWALQASENGDPYARQLLLVVQ